MAPFIPILCRFGARINSTEGILCPLGPVQGISTTDNSCQDFSRLFSFSKDKPEVVAHLFGYSLASFSEENTSISKKEQLVFQSPHNLTDPFTQSFGSSLLNHAGKEVMEVSISWTSTDHMGAGMWLLRACAVQGMEIMMMTCWCLRVKPAVRGAATEADWKVGNPVSPLPNKQKMGHDPFSLWYIY